MLGRHRRDGLHTLLGPRAGGAPDCGHKPRASYCLLSPGHHGPSQLAVLHLGKHGWTHGWICPYEQVTLLPCDVT